VIKALLKKAVITGPFSYFASTALGRLIILCFPSRYQTLLLSGIRHPQTIRIRISGIEFKLRSSIEDDHFQNAFLKQLKGWEDEVIATWVNLIKRDEIAIDVGAYLGIYSILGASMGASLVLAYEPNPFTISRLQQNIDLNDFNDRVLVRDVALASSSMEGFLEAPKGRKLSSGTMLSSHKIQANEDHSNNWERIAKVKLVKLDEEIQKLEHPVRISVIKIDAEGSEMDVLEGAQKTLVNYRPYLIIELLDYESLRKATTYLTKINYAVPKALDGAPHTKTTFTNSRKIIATNYLFRPK
jgi:FkbM family methyltransferase